MAAPCNSQEERATSSHHRLQTHRQCLPTQAACPTLLLKAMPPKQLPPAQEKRRMGAACYHDAREASNGPGACPDDAHGVLRCPGQGIH